jgi:hypothetical protein
MRYNGWCNWETWNCALWMGNDESIYRLALRSKTFDEFLDVMLNEWNRPTTPDDAKWTDANRNEMIEAFDDLKGDS